MFGWSLFCVFCFLFFKVYTYACMFVWSFYSVFVHGRLLEFLFLHVLLLYSGVCVCCLLCLPACLLCWAVLVVRICWPLLVIRLSCLCLFVLAAWLLVCYAIGVFVCCCLCFCRNCILAVVFVLLLSVFLAAVFV